jgi:CHASE3 domain sensor protein
MANSLRKITLRLTIPVLCGLIALNAFLVFNHLNAIRKISAQRAQASRMHAGISPLSLDLLQMETAQRAFLITGDSPYLDQYESAKAAFSDHLAGLRSQSANTLAQDRSRQSQVESLAQSMIAEMDETIRLRKLGYRHRAFLIVASNRGKQLMEQARATLDALSSQQAATLAAYDLDMRATLGHAARQSALASFLLLLITIAAFFAFTRHRRLLEQQSATHAEQLRVTTAQLEQVESRIFHDVRARLDAIRTDASSLLDGYGDYLPPQGQQKAERIDEGAGQMISLLEDLAKNSPRRNSADGWCPPASEQPQHLTVQ